MTTRLKYELYRGPRDGDTGVMEFPARDTVERVHDGQIYKYIFTHREDTKEGKYRYEYTAPAKPPGPSVPDPRQT